MLLLVVFTFYIPICVCLVVVGIDN